MSQHWGEEISGRFSNGWKHVAAGAVIVAVVDVFWSTGGAVAVSLGVMLAREIAQLWEGVAAWLNGWKFSAGLAKGMNLNRAWNHWWWRRNFPDLYIEGRVLELRRPPWYLVFLDLILDVAEWLLGIGIWLWVAPTLEAYQKIAG